MYSRVASSSSLSGSDQVILLGAADAASTLGTASDLAVRGGVQVSLGALHLVEQRLLRGLTRPARRLVRVREIVTVHLPSVTASRISSKAL